MPSNCPGTPRAGNAAVETIMLSSLLAALLAAAPLFAPAVRRCTRLLRPWLRRRRSYASTRRRHTGRLRCAAGCPAQGCTATVCVAMTALQLSCLACQARCNMQPAHLLSLRWGLACVDAWLMPWRR